MRPWPWEPTGWKYPFLHLESPPSTRKHIRPREKRYKEIANEKLKKNYFKTSYSSQFKDRIGFKNCSKSQNRKGSGFKDTDRLNEYLVERGIPENSNYISAWYPPVQLSLKGVNEEYLKLKKYGPVYKMEKDRNNSIQEIPHNNNNNRRTANQTTRHSPIPIVDEEWYLKCK